MFNGVHAEAREWLNVGVPVVEAVDVLIHGRDVDKSKKHCSFKVEVGRSCE